MSLFDLKRLREHAGLTQTALSKRLSISQVQISRYETNPDSVPVGLINEYLHALGLDFSSAMLMLEQEKQIQQLVLKDIPPLLLQRIELARTYLDFIQQDDFAAQLNIIDKHLVSNLLNSAIRKPFVLFAGQFDAGKSHLANTLLGGRYLPTGYQPETRLIIFVRHIEDKPEYMKEDVWILNNQFEHQLWAQEEHTTACKIKAGNTYTLKEWASYKQTITDDTASAALVFLDTEILKGCQIIDIPGDLHNQQDSAIIRGLDFNTDVLIYASQAKGFMSSEDIICLKQLLTSLMPLDTFYSAFPRLGNLYLVVTHADPSLSASQLESISSKGMERLAQGEENLTIEELLNRCFYFWSETSARRTALIEDLIDLLSYHLPLAIAARLDHEFQQLQQSINLQYTQVIKSCYQLQPLIVEKNQYQLIQQLKLLENTLDNNNHLLAIEIKQLLKELKMQSREELESIYAAQINHKSIEQLIHTAFQESQQARQYASGLVYEQLYKNISQMIEGKLQQLEAKIIQSIKDISHFSLQSEQQDIRIQLPIPYNLRGIFFGSMASLAGISPMAAWASTLGSWGGYLVLVESAAALGLGNGVAMATVSTVATIGGPGILATALLITGAVLGGKYMGTSWQQRLAHALVKYFNQHQLKKQFIESMENYWLELENNLIKQIQLLENSHQSYVHGIAEILHESEDPQQKLQQLIDYLETSKTQMNSIPWKNIEQIELKKKL